MLEGRADEYFDFTLFDDEGRGPEVSFPADNFARLEAPAYDGTLVPAEELLGDSMKERMIEQLLAGQLLGALSLLCHDLQYDAAIGQGSGRAGDHALATGHAGGLAHRIVEVEGDARLVPLVHPADDLVVADFVTAANATVAEDAGIVIDGDDQRAVILTSILHRARKGRVVRIDAELLGDGPQLIIAILLVHLSRPVVVGQQ